MTKIARLLGTLTLAAASVALPSLASGATMKTVKLSNCGTFEAKPTSIVISCADANITVTHITWTGWGHATAHGVGTLNWNTCTPTCVAGTWKHKHLVFSARGLRGGYYTTLVGPAGAFGTGTTWTLPSAR